jgi:hypothetical protein
MPKPSRYDELRAQREAKFARAQAAMANPVTEIVTKTIPTNSVTPTISVTNSVTNSVTHKLKPGPKPSGKALPRAEIQRRYRQRKAAASQSA